MKVGDGGNVDPPSPRVGDGGTGSHGWRHEAVIRNGSQAGYATRPIGGAGIGCLGSIQRAAPGGALQARGRTSGYVVGHSQDDPPQLKRASSAGSAMPHGRSGRRRQSGYGDSSSHAMRHSDSKKVLLRSRQLLWQRLEREVRAAFEAACFTDSNAETLEFTDFDTFLVNLKCLPPAERRFNEDSTALCGALWRHLDVENAGRVDLLTLTVFFSVLLGGMHGEPAGALSNGGSSCGSLSSPSTAIGGEVGAMAVAMCANRPGKLEDNRRIAELLVRFDAQRLRAEFKEMYQQRMYRLAAEHSASHQQSNGDSFSPSPRRELSPRSHKLAVRFEERLRDGVAAAAMAEEGVEASEINAKIASHQELLYYWMAESDAKKQAARAQKSVEEVRECTFRPRVNRRSSRSASPDQGRGAHIAAHGPKDPCAEVGQPAADAGVTDPSAVVPSRCSRKPRVHELLYSLSVAQRQQKNLLKAHYLSARNASELADCTFRPNIGRSMTSFQREKGSAPQYPRGFHQSRNRLRAGGAIRAEVFRMEDDRTAKMQHPSPVTDFWCSRAPSQPAISPSGASQRFFTVECQEEVTPTSAPRSASALAGVPRSVLRDYAEVCGGRVAAIPEEVYGEEEEEEFIEAVEEKEETRRATSAPPGWGGHRATVPDNARASIASTGCAHSAAFEPHSMGAAPAVVEQRSTSMAQEEEDIRPMLFKVEVKIRVDEPPAMLVLREGDTASQVAADFASKHALTPQMAHRLYCMLDQQILASLEPAHGFGTLVTPRPR